MIPKILHQTAPTNKENWHPLWHKCQQSWLTHFKDFEYRLWNDEEIDLLVQKEYPQYWEIYNNFIIHILKIDFVRFCFMHKYGGIYADMDYFCYSNFYDELIENIYLVENPYGNDPIENSLMCSEPNHPFWIECMDLVEERFNYYNKKFPHRFQDLKLISLDPEKGLKIRPWLVFGITGTNLISSQARLTNLTIYTLPSIFYNNNDMSYNEQYRAKHIHTGLWGKESIAVFYYDEKHIKTLRNIPLDEFCFYTDYSNGNYLTSCYNDFDKNNSDEKINLASDYEYK